MSTSNPSRRYLIWQALGLSFYSKDLYRDVKSNWKGTGLGFLWLLLSAFVLVYAAQIQIQAVHQIPGFAQKIPPFQITKGIFSSKVSPQPYRINVDDGCIVVDTTGKIKTLDEIADTQGLHMVVLVTKTGFLTRQAMEPDKSVPFVATENLDVTQEKLDYWTKMTVAWSGTLFFIFLLLFFFLAEAVLLSVYTLLAVLFAEVAKKSLENTSAYRLVVISHIPGLLVFNALIMAGIHLPLFGLWCVLVSLGYVYYAVQSLESKT